MEPVLDLSQPSGGIPLKISSFYLRAAMTLDEIVMVTCFTGGGICCYNQGAFAGLLGLLCTAPCRPSSVPYRDKRKKTDPLLLLG